MSELAAPLQRVLEATGYLSDGKPATPSVVIGEEHATSRRHLSFGPDARWRSRTDGVTIYFKFAPDVPEDPQVASWQQEVWNEGASPLLWVVCPDQVDVYNGFAVPRRAGKAPKLKTYNHSQLPTLDGFAGRLVMETGQFWRDETRVNRQNAVDRRLLDHLGVLQADLVGDGLSVIQAQGLIGRSVFARYLVDRNIVTEQQLLRRYGKNRLEDVLRDRDGAQSLFDWFRDTFNGDMFPSSTGIPGAAHLERVARFLEGEDPRTGQPDLFPYRFDVIPVELLSAIYEQFVHARTVAGGPKKSSTGVHYTPPAVVSLVLDEVMQDLTGNETVLDLTCGSGIFLVEALRRLVRLKARRVPLNRAMIRETLYRQIFGVDISEPAVQVAAFSLVLAALELDPDPGLTRSLRFRELRGNTLLVGNAFDAETTAAGGERLTTRRGLRTFDLIVGNPPWGRDNSHEQTAMPPFKGATSLRYLSRATAFAHDGTRFGMVLSATAFFSRYKARLATAQALVEELSPVTLANLSNLSSWLFRQANMPAMVLLARYRNQDTDQVELVQTEWSPASRSHAIEIMPSNVSSLRLATWRRRPELLKATFYGKSHDRLLLDDPPIPLSSLAESLNALGVRFSEGLKRGSDRDAKHLLGMPLVEKGSLRPFAVSPPSRKWGEHTAARPRDAKIYRAPLLLIEEFMVPSLGGGPRTRAAVARHDAVYTDALDGASFADSEADLADLVTAILASAFATWYFMMASSEFGLWKRRIFLGDIKSVPVPDLSRGVASPAGQRVLALARSFERSEPTDKGWRKLDEAIFDLYQFDAAERLVVRDGLFRASWQWKAGRQASVSPVGKSELESYAHAFVSVVDPWFDAANKRRVRGEIMELPSSAPLRIARFVVEQHPPPSHVQLVAPSGTLTDELSNIGARLGVSIMEELAEHGELRLGNDNEVVFIRPAGRRHWLASAALGDARKVLRDSFKAIAG